MKHPMKLKCALTTTEIKASKSMHLREDNLDGISKIMGKKMQGYIERRLFAPLPHFPELEKEKVSNFRRYEPLPSGEVLISPLTIKDVDGRRSDWEKNRDLTRELAAKQRRMAIEAFDEDEDCDIAT